MDPNECICQSTIAAIAKSNLKAKASSFQQILGDTKQLGTLVEKAKAIRNVFNQMGAGLYLIQGGWAIDRAQYSNPGTNENNDGLVQPKTKTGAKQTTEICVNIPEASTQIVKKRTTSPHVQPIL
ncbi:MAG: hypothetical protein VYA34_07345 [Myxococcota bacterium]|nr:hypothetical protein [Myxococcota bacterium]